MVRAASLPIPTQLAEHPELADPARRQRDGASARYIKRGIRPKSHRVRTSGWNRNSSAEDGQDGRRSAGPDDAPIDTAELGRIQAPTLVIWGEADRVIPARHAQFALQAIQDCRAVLIAEAGHGPQIDRPEVFNAIVLEFLAAGNWQKKAPTETK